MLTSTDAHMVLNNIWPSHFFGFWGSLKLSAGSGDFSRIFLNIFIAIMNKKPWVCNVAVSWTCPPVPSIMFAGCSWWIEAESACRAHRLTAYISTLYAVYYSPNMALILTLGEISLPKVDFHSGRWAAVMLLHVNVSIPFDLKLIHVNTTHICS